MRRFFLSLLFLLPVVANAQEQPDWTGFYAGMGIAATQTSFDEEVEHRRVPVGFGDSPYLEISAPGSSQVGLTGASLLAGYGWQLGRAYLGVEGDIDLSGAVFADQHLFAGNGSRCEPVGVCLIYNRTLRLDVLGRARGLFGVVVDPAVMGFASAGVAWAKAETVANALAMVEGVGVTDTDSASEVLAGLTLGAGVEVKATSNLRVRAEVMIDGFADLPYDLSAEAQYCPGSCNWIRGRNVARRFLRTSQAAWR